VKIVRNGQAGTLESGDVMVIVSPRSSEDGAQLELDVHSIVEAQYGEEIRRVVRETLSELGVVDARVTIQDRGALDYCIRARVEAAAHRATAADGEK
jgi:citrate lyase subunit gamma (acyl carrier protein)